VQTTLLGLAIAFIVALVAALVGPYFIDWNQFRPQFEAEAAKVVGAPVRVSGGLEARLLPTPSLRLSSVTVGGANDLGKFRADKLDVEFSLGDLMRGEWRANQLTIGGLALDLGLDRQGRIDLPVTHGQFNLGALSIDRLNLTGRVALHDAASRKTLELNDIAFSGDVRALAGAMRGDGSFAIDGSRYPFRVSSGQTSDGNGTRIHLSIDPGDEPLSADLDGVLSFEARAPHFDGTLTLASPAPQKAKTGETTPWRIVAKVRADHVAAELDQIDASYGPEERALKFAGVGDVRFGASPLLKATLSARQLDADRFLAKDNTKENTKDSAKDNGAVVPVQLLATLRPLAAALPHPPLPMQIEVGAEQIMLGGRALQNLVADLHGDIASWAIDRLDARAPGATHVAFNGTAALTGPSGNFSGALDIDCADPDMLMTWLQGRSDIAYRNRKPLRLRGDVNVTADGVAIDQLKAEIDGGAVEGRVAVVTEASNGSRVEAALKAERLDLDAATSFVRSIAGQSAEWPARANVSLNIDHAVTAGRDLHPFITKFSYGPKTISLEQLRFAEAGGVTTDASGNFDRVDATGKLALSAEAASLGQITALLTPLAPVLAGRLNAFATQRGPARLKLALDLKKNPDAADRANARAVVDLGAPQLSGTATITAKPELAAIRALDRDAIGRTEIGVVTKLTSQRADAMLALLGLDQAVAVGEGTAQFEGSISGTWRAPLRLNVKLWGPGIDAEALGTAEPWAETPKASLDLKIRSVNLAPLFGLRPADSFAKDIRLFGRASLAGNKLNLDDIDSIVARSRLRGHLALTLGAEKQIDGEVGLDTLDLAPAFALAIGGEGRDAAEPLGTGLLKGWRGQIAFQALGGTLPGGLELRPVSGTVRSDGQSLTLDSIKGKIGGGEALANIDARQDPNGISLIAHLDLTDAYGTALYYRGLKMPAGRTSLQMTLSSQGRSASALLGALSGGGNVKLESSAIAGLDPRAFDLAIRASDNGQVQDDTKLRQLVEPILTAGSLPVALAEIPFTVQDGRIHVDATTLDASGARAKVSGGYDIPADQADIHVTLTSTTQGSEGARPELQLFAVGSPDALNRTVDVSLFSRWLALRAIDRETRRLDSLERGGPQVQPMSVPPSSVPPPTVPPSTAGLPQAALPQATAPEPTLSQPPALPMAPPRRTLPRVVTPPRPPAATVPPVLSQQVAPLPPPIEVRPAPAPPPRPKPKPPLVLAPPATNP
jgi:uncharacterized protein involved in outer membrane biogenesis